MGISNFGNMLSDSSVNHCHAGNLGFKSLPPSLFKLYNVEKNSRCSLAA